MPAKPPSKIKKSDPSASYTWESLGQHRLRVGDDILYVVCNGGFNLEEMKRIMVESYALGEKYGYVLCLFDVTNAGWSTPEARRYQATNLRERLYPHLTALVGINAVLRVAVGLVDRAVEIVTGKTLTNVFTDDEAAALAALSKARQSFIEQGIAKRRIPSDGNQAGPG